MEVKEGTHLNIGANTNNGQMAYIINNYRDYFNKMDLGSLVDELSILVSEKKMMIKGHREDPSVIPFITSVLLVTIVYMAGIFIDIDTSNQISMEIKYLLLFLGIASFISFFVTWWYMEKNRKALSNAIQYQNETIKRVEAAIAFKELEAKRDKTKS
jgi:hypothetical protein